MSSGGGLVELADGRFAQLVVLGSVSATPGSPTKTEDTAAASGDAGTPAMAVQTASPADAATAGDYAFLQMKDGGLWVNITGAVAGAVTETAPTTDTASSGLNGRLQRIAQRLTTMIGGAGLTASAAFTPAASSHDGASAGSDVGDVVGGAQTFTLGAPASSNFLIRSVSMLIASATVATTAWKLHLFSVTPPSAIADDAVFDLPSGDQASYLGYIVIPQIVDMGAGQWIESNNIFKQVKLGASGNLFAYLTNDTTLTPEAVAHTVTINGSVC
jgi:hypothetical protein